MSFLDSVREIVLPYLTGTLKTGDVRNMLLPHNTLSRKMRKMVAACEPRSARFDPRSIESAQKHMGIKYVEW